MPGQPSEGSLKGDRGQRGMLSPRPQDDRGQAHLPGRPPEG